MPEFEVCTADHDVRDEVLRVVAELGLVVQLEATLRKYPDSLHWHIRRPKGPGTVEVNYWPVTGRCWVSYHDFGRGDGWPEEAAPKLADALRKTIPTHDPA